MACPEILKLEGIFDVITAPLWKVFFLVSVTIENILVTENHSPCQNARYATCEM